MVVVPLVNLCFFHNFKDIFLNSIFKISRMIFVFVNSGSGKDARLAIPCSTAAVLFS